MAASPSNCDHESIFHTPLLVEKVLLGLPSPADVARAALVSRTWLDTACSRRVLEKQQKQQPLLGLYFPRPDLSPGGVMSFHAASSAMSDPALARFLNRRSKPLPDILEGDPNWSPLDCRDGRLLLSKEGRRAVYDTTCGRCIAEFPQCHLQDDEPHTNTIAECLLQGHGGDRESFRVVCIQHCRRGAGLRAVEYSSHAREWRSYGWQSHLKKPSENQAMQGGRYIFWRYEACFLLILDTTTTVFSKLCVPSYLCVQYAVGDTADGRSCLITLDDTHLKLWLLEENGTLKGKFSRVRPDMDVPLSHVEGLPDSLYFCIHSVTKGIAILYIYSYREIHKRQFAVDIENKLLCGEFYSEAFGYPLFMQWPPALLVKTGATETSGMNHTAVEETEEAETKADVAEENEQFWQSSSQITVVDTQIANLRTEKTQLSQSLEEERQRASGSQQECLAIKEELARQEGRANQLEQEIKKLRARHKTELQAAAEHRELLEKITSLSRSLEEERQRASGSQRESSSSLCSAAAFEDQPQNNQQQHHHHNNDQQQNQEEEWPAWDQAAQAAPAAQGPDHDHQSGVSSASVNNMVVRGQGPEQHLVIKPQQHLQANVYPMQIDQLQQDPAPQQVAQKFAQEEAQGFQLTDFLPAGNVQLEQEGDFQWTEFLPAANIQQGNVIGQAGNDQGQNDLVEAKEGQQAQEKELDNSSHSAPHPMDITKAAANPALNVNQNAAKSIVSQRKRFNMFKFVHKRIIERTYQRKNKNKKRKTKEIAQTPLTTEGLRRSKKMNELNEGEHKPQQIQSSSGHQLRSSTHKDGINQELESEKASRGEFEKTSSRDAPEVPLPDQTRNAPRGKLWSAGSTNSLEEISNPLHTARSIVNMCRTRPVVSRAPPCAVAELCTKRKKTVDDKAMPKRSRRPSVKLCGSEWVS